VRSSERNRRDGLPTLERLGVELAAGSDEGGDVGYRTTNSVALTGALDVYRLTEVSGPLPHNRQEWHRGLVTRRQCHFAGHRLLLCDDLRRKVLRDLELGTHRIERMTQQGGVSPRTPLSLLVSQEIDPSHRHESHPSQNLGVGPVLGSPTLGEVLILLPPSESKTGRVRGKPADPALVSFPELAATRTAVAETLARVSAHPEAPALLGVSTNLRADIAHNIRLDSAPAVPVAITVVAEIADAAGDL